MEIDVVFPYLSLIVITPIFLICAQTEQAIDLLMKVENISGPTLELKDKYMKILANYSRDLDAVRKLYQKQKADPVVPRNLPPVSGKIAWARQLYRRIEAPMKVYKKKPDILKVNRELIVHFTPLP